MKENEGWWKGDYDGQLQLWFPATFVEEIHQENCENNVCMVTDIYLSNVFGNSICILLDDSQSIF